MVKRHKQEKTTFSDRGKPVAALSSGHESEKQQGDSQGFWEAYQKFRQEIGLHRVAITSHTFGRVRDKAPGREFKL
jgi:hypothetical protein